MSEFIKVQQEVRANLTEQIRDIIESAEMDKRGLDAAELEKIDRIEADINSADSAIRAAKRNEERKAELSVAAQGFIPSVAPSMNDAEQLRSLARSGGSHEFRAALVPTSGSGVVGDTFYDRVFEVIRGTNPIFETSTLITTEGGNLLQVPQLTAYSTATIKGAGTAIDESNPTLSNINLGAFKYSFLVNLSNELIQDASVDIRSLIADASGRAIAYDAGTGLTTGTGTVQPTGIVTASALGVTGGTGVTGAFTADNLIDLAYSVEGGSRAGYGYMMNAKSIGLLRKLKDTAGNYVFQPGVGADARDLLLGQTVFENPAMANTGTSAKSVVYGKLDDFIVRQAGGIQVATSTDYAFNTDVTTFRVTWRGDSNLGAAGSVKHFIGGAS
jgi:HK97 family phage major capsid protein